MTPARPRLTFACELDAARLTRLFADPTVIEQLRALGARVALMLSDLSSERAAVVRQLNGAAIPVVGIPLMPYEAGYYFTTENAPGAAARYGEWKAWTAQEGLRWDAVGLDIEPDARIFEQIMANPWGLVRLLPRRLLGGRQLEQAHEAYAALIRQIHADGYQVENYQFPLIAEERRVGSTLLRRLLGLVDVRTDREVWMLYTSFMPTVGPGLLWSYGPEAAAIAVGTTGGGPDVPGHPQLPALAWPELARDLRLALRWTDDLYVHSLEGCVWHEFLPRLVSFDWQPAVEEPAGVRRAEASRRLLRAVLWADAHRWRVLGAVAASAWLATRRRRARTPHRLDP